MKTYTYKELYRSEYKDAAENFLYKATDCINEEFFNLDVGTQYAVLEENAWEPLEHMSGSVIHEMIDSCVMTNISKGVREGWFKIVESK